MIFDQFSRTAEAAAALRAWGRTTPAGRAVFDDPHALSLIKGAWRPWLRYPGFVTRLMHGPLFWLRPIAAQVLTRSHHAEQRLAAAVARGVRQYVIVGAGLDSFCWRRPEWARDLTVFEIDHPATQAMKQVRIRAAGLAGAPRWVAANFERESVADALQRSAFDPTRPVFFAWLGVTHYLQPAATRATLKALADIAAPGSELVFDYSLLPRRIAPHDWPLAAGLGLATAIIGEPLVGGLDPDILTGWASEGGWQIVSDLTGPPAGALRAPDVTRLVHWRRGLRPVLEGVGKTAI